MANRHIRSNRAGALLRHRRLECSWSKEFGHGIAEDVSWHDTCHIGAMAKHPIPSKPDDPEQYRRFVEVARELGVDENDPEAMDRAFKNVVRPIQPDQTRAKLRKLAATAKRERPARAPKASN